MVQPRNRNPSRAIEKVGSFVQVPTTPFKGTLIYLSESREEEISFSVIMFLLGLLLHGFARLMCVG